MIYKAREELEYEEALKIIDSRRRPQRPKTSEVASNAQDVALRISGTPDLRGAPSIAGMSEWLGMLGHSDADINALNIIHIAGTEGKGSTAAFTESFLRAHFNHSTPAATLKTDLYTSPHLIDPPERIRLNGEPLAHHLFTSYLHEILPHLPPPPTGPRTLQLYLLLALHVFIRTGVSVGVIEAHHGGEYDATNFISRPVVTAITALGMDHIEQLGPTLANIAWHKAGIFKTTAPAFSAPQDDEAAVVFAARAHEKATSLRVTPAADPRLPASHVALSPDVQRRNASLALAVSDAFLKQTSSKHVAAALSPKDIEVGLAQFDWPGRFQILLHPGTESRADLRFHLDAAHNAMSVQLAGKWFAEITGNAGCDSGIVKKTLGAKKRKVLVFGHDSTSRDAGEVLRSLVLSLKETQVAELDDVVFCNYVVGERGGDDGNLSSVEGAGTAEMESESMRLFREIWKETFPESSVWAVKTIRHAVRKVEFFGEEEKSQASPAGELQVLVTGSQHVVGPVLQILRGG